MKYNFLILFLLLALSACSTANAPIATAIVQTQAAAATQAMLAQQHTQMAIANLLLTQNAVSLNQQQTQSAILQTQAALNAQQQIQASIAQTQAAVVANPPTQATSEESTPIPGVNPISSTGVDFTGAKIYSQGSLGSRQYMVSIQLSESVKEISGTYFLEVAAKRFKCSVIKDYPNRLYCNGPSPRGGYHAVRVYEDLSGLARLVMVTDITTPIWTPTFIHGGLPSPTE